GIRLKSGVWIDRGDDDQALRVAARKMRQQERTDQAEHGGVDGNTERERNYSGRGKAGRFDQLAQGKSDVGHKAFGGGPQPDFAAALFNEAEVADFAARTLLCLRPGRAVLHELVGPFRDVFVDGDGEVVVTATARQELRYPGHGEAFLDLGNSKYARDAGEHLFEAHQFPFQVKNARVRQSIDARRTPLCRNSGFR